MFCQVTNSSSSRKDNCLLKPQSLNKIDKKWKRMQKYFKKKNNEKRFARKLKKIYHASVHLAIGKGCKTKPDDFDSAMSFDAASARDPVFYRWRSFFSVKLNS